MPVVIVVIPYFQRAPGLLAGALRSVAAQDANAELRVIVVDDGSPARASDELASIQDLSLNVRVVYQSNAGPGAARNAALDQVGDDAQFVAFLDSDDRWRPQHLSRALVALASGADVYFSNLVHLNADASAFERSGRIAAIAKSPISAELGLWAFDGDMLNQVVMGNLIGTPTVVYRHGRFADHRFRPEFRRAGEDYLFWMGLAAKKARFCFGTEPMVDCGRGVNVYSGAGWGTDGFARRLYDELLYRIASEREFQLSAPANKHVKAQKRALAESFGADLAHRVRHRLAVDWPLIAAFSRRRPLWPVEAAMGLLRR
jgi:succinoglycan biosynthesis protein ExoW